jgi:hypothetical protein
MSSAKTQTAAKAQTVVGFDPERFERWDLWYDTPRWKKRARAQIKAQPMCESCLAVGQVVRADYVIHVRPHHGEWAAFIRPQKALRVESGPAPSERQSSQKGG